MRALITVVLVAVLASSFPAPVVKASACDAPVFVADVGWACARPDGLLDVLDDEGALVATTHGPDPAPANPTFNAGTAPPPRPPVCVAPGTAYSHRVIYARASNVADRYAEMAPQVRRMVEVATGYMWNGGSAFGLGIAPRVQCSSGTIIVDAATLPTPVASRTFSTVVSDLQALGYNDPKVKYWVWHDDGSSRGCGGGVGSVYSDDRPGVENWNNGNGVALFGVTWNCLDLSGAQVMSHENGHNMGAVQNSAPRSTLGLHCIDGLDIMCYDDDGANGNLYTETRCAVRVYDCGNDDYFHPFPAGGSYLATHWNVAGTNNRFVARNACPLLASGQLVAGTPPGSAGVGVFGWNVAVVPVPSSCWGHAFRLTADPTISVGPQDFDSCMEKVQAGTTTRLGCQSTHGLPSDETGVIPTGTTQVSVWYFAGVEGRWILYGS